MSSQPDWLDQEIAEYWHRASTPGGRLSVRARLWFKRRLWKSVVGGSVALKRLLDIIGSACGLVALSPVFGTTALLIKIEDRGPLFFKQTRVGMRGRTFGMWKFRSMVVNADALKDKLLQQNEMKGGVIFKMKDDPRITKVGKWIRKFSIDELPQLLNILQGDMSLVGPRPPVPREVAEYSVEDRQRLLAKPGLTCFWQVGGRSDIDFAGQVRLDIAYIRSESVWLDVKLLFKTVPAVLLGKGAY
jgi:lipopolysaccharide/colanic/teichoic acid biosynthesis glycosyltransferase